MRRRLCSKQTPRRGVSTACKTARYGNAVGSSRAPWERRVRAVNTLQQLLARCKNVLDAVGTLGDRRVHALTGQFDICMRI